MKIPLRIKGVENREEIKPPELRNKSRFIPGAL
jgi:hypothetical protein